MEKISLAIISIATLANAIMTIANAVNKVKKPVNKAIEKKLEEILAPTNKKIDSTNEYVKKLDKNQCKNYLTEFLADVKNGVHKDQNQIARANEVYDHYIQDLDGNSYIHSTWDKLMK